MPAAEFAAEAAGPAGPPHKPAGEHGKPAGGPGKPHGKGPGKGKGGKGKGGKGGKGGKKGQIKTIKTDAEFDKAVAAGKKHGVVMRFTSPGCGAKCSKINTAYQKLAATNPSVTFLTGDLKALTKSATKHKVNTKNVKISPAFLYIRPKGNEIQSLGPDIMALGEGLGAVQGHAT